MQMRGKINSENGSVRVLTAVRTRRRQFNTQPGEGHSRPVGWKSRFGQLVVGQVRSGREGRCC